MEAIKNSVIKKKKKKKKNSVIGKNDTGESSWKFDQ